MFPDLTHDDVFRIETKRLWLRWPRASDAVAVQKFAGELQVAEMTSNIPHPYPKRGAEAFILTTREANTEGRTLRLAITGKRQPNALIGMIGLEPRERCEPELGYWLGRPFWGQGYATEAAQALIDAVFTYGGTTVVEAGARVINPASRRVLEKSGFQYAGSAMLERPAWRDSVPVDRFRLERSNWESLKNWRMPVLTMDRPAKPKSGGLPLQPCA